MKSFPYHRVSVLAVTRAAVLSFLGVDRARAEAVVSNDQNTFHLEPLIRLYTHPFSIVPWRVRIALHEKSVDYEMVETNLYSERPTAAFLELNPFAQIPVLDDDGFVIAESIAILEYLEEKYPTPALLPDDLERRATIRKLVCWGTDYWPGAWKKWMAPRLPAGLADA